MRKRKRRSVIDQMTKEEVLEYGKNHTREREVTGEKLKKIKEMIESGEAREISEEEATRRIMHNYEKGREWRRSYDRHERRKAKNTHVNAHDNREDKRG